MRKKAGNLSVRQEELDIKSTGARNDYILSLASANAHQEQYFRNDLQVNTGVIFERMWDKVLFKQLYYIFDNIIFHNILGSNKDT